MKQSAKYPEWTFETEFKNGREQATMLHNSGIYAIACWKEAKHGWVGELMTQQFCKMTGRKSWEVAKNQPDVFTIAEIAAEAERRAKAILAKYAVPA